MARRKQKTDEDVAVSFSTPEGEEVHTTTERLREMAEQVKNGSQGERLDRREEPLCLETVHDGRLLVRANETLMEACHKAAPFVGEGSGMRWWVTTSVTIEIDKEGRPWVYGTTKLTEPPVPTPVQDVTFEMGGATVDTCGPRPVQLELVPAG